MVQKEMLSSVLMPKTLEMLSLSVFLNFAVKCFFLKEELLISALEIFSEVKLM
jgi:hypothetical protein